MVSIPTCFVNFTVVSMAISITHRWWETGREREKETERARKREGEGERGVIKTCQDVGPLQFYIAEWRLLVTV